MATKPKKYKLDAFRLLNAIDNRDFKFYDSLNEEEKKGFAGVVAMRWMSSAKNMSSFAEMWNIIATNDNVNKNLWSSKLSGHPKLIYLTMAMSGIGHYQRHQWINAPSKRNTGPVFDFIRKIYPMASDSELELFLIMNDVGDFVELATDMGWTKPEITKLKNELKKVK